MKKGGRAAPPIVPFPGKFILQTKKHDVKG